MKLAAVKEAQAGENRVALVPESVKKLVKAGVEVIVESGCGSNAYIPDDAYREAGATVESGAAAILGKAEFVFMVAPPTAEQIDQMQDSAYLLTTLLPTKNTDTVKKLAEKHISAFSTDAIPRITRAQSMDTLSSMANIGGYKAVLIAANELPKYFPMFMTAAGTIFAAKVFVIGAGVAGLQAIATAKRLGATVEATDTRSAVREQVESLGGKFASVETEEEAETEGGYAKELSQDFYRRQAELIKQRCAANDVVITTALIGGVKAPKLITREMVDGMKPGSVIVDLAAPAGGNCELTKPGETAVHNGVRICAPLNLPSEMAMHASILYSRNLTTFFLEFWKDNEFKLNLEDEIIAGALITHQDEVRHAGARQALEGGKS